MKTNLTFEDALVMFAPVASEVYTHSYDDENKSISKQFKLAIEFMKKYKKYKDEQEEGYLKERKME